MQGVAELGGGNFFSFLIVSVFFFSFSYIFFSKSEFGGVFFLCSLPSDPSGQLNVLGHNCYPLSVDGTQIGVLKETHQISFACFLKSKKKPWVNRNKMTVCVRERRDIMQLRQAKVVSRFEQIQSF